MDYKHLSEKQNAILKSAYQVFTEKGFHQAKVSEIAQLAGVGKGTIYEYYVSKEDLLRGVIQVGMLYYLEEIKKHLRNSDTFWGKMESIFIAHANFLMKHKSFKKVIGDHFSIINKEFHDWMIKQQEQMIVLVQEVVEEGMANGEIAARRKDWTAKTVLSVMAGLNDCQEEIDSKDKVDFVLQILKNGLQREEE